MADKTIGLKVEVDSKQATKSLGDLENEFERLNEEIRKVPINSKEFDELNKQIAQTGREVKNLELSMESLDNEQVASELGSVAGAVGDVSAAFILLGDDSETMQEVAKNIELAMGLSMGLKGAIEGVSSARKLLTNSTVVQNTVEKISNLVKVGAFATNAQLAASEVARGTATVGATAATSAATVGMKLFRLALIATGFGALIVGLGLLIANFDKVSGAVRKVADWVLGLSDKFQELGTSAKVLIGFLTFGIAPAISFLIEKAKEWGIVETKEARERRERVEQQLADAKAATKRKIDLIDQEIKANKKLTEELTSAIDFEIAKRSAAGKDISELEEEKLNMLINATKIEIDLINQKIKAKQEEVKVSQLISGLVQDIEVKAYENQRQNQLDSLTNLTQDLELFHIKQRKLKSDEVAKAKEDRDKNNDKEVEDEKKKNEELLKEKQRLRDEAFKLKLEGIIAEEKAAEDYRKRQLNEEQKEIDDLNERFNSELEAIGDNNELRLLLEDEFQANVKAIEDKYKKEREVAAKEKKEKEEEDARTELEKKLEEVSKFNQSIIGLNDAVLEAQLAGAEGNEAKQEEFRKKAFERNKKLQLAQATIDGVRAVISTYGSTPGGLIIKSAAAAIAGITALANIKKIASTAYAGSSGGGSAPSSLGNTGRGANGANVGQVTNTTTTIGEPTRVYVTEQDISNTQNKVSVNEAQATI